MPIHRAESADPAKEGPGPAEKRGRARPATEGARNALSPPGVEAAETSALPLRIRQGQQAEPALLVEPDEREQLLIADAVE